MEKVLLPFVYSLLIVEFSLSELPCSNNKSHFQLLKFITRGWAFCKLPCSSLAGPFYINESMIGLPCCVILHHMGIPVRTTHFTIFGPLSSGHHSGAPLPTRGREQGLVVLWTPVLRDVSKSGSATPWFSSGFVGLGLIYSNIHYEVQLLPWALICSYLLIWVQIYWFNVTCSTNSYSTCRPGLFWNFR